MPIRRPRRGRLELKEWEERNARSVLMGKNLKYSGEYRYKSSFSPSHKEYKALPNPPAPGSNYHRYAGEIARLELVDSLMCLAYGLWCTEMRQGSCKPINWESAGALIAYVKNKWSHHDSDAEKAFVGLM
jgi:hypothetical protein